MRPFPNILPGAGRAADHFPCAALFHGAGTAATGRMSLMSTLNVPS